jgi:hypothetical protein
VIGDGRESKLARQVAHVVKRLCASQETSLKRALLGAANTGGVTHTSGMRLSLVDLACDDVR